MKWLFRSFVFVAAFLVGVIAYAFTIPSSGLSHCTFDIPLGKDLIHDELRTTAPRPRGISVLYAGLTSDDEDDSAPMLSFVIVNGSFQTKTYASKSPWRPTPLLTANGKDLPKEVLSCGNEKVPETFYILPGTSAEVYVHPGHFLERPRKSADITAGFYLSTPSEASTELYTSEKFHLPEEFRNAIGSVDGFR